MQGSVGELESDYWGVAAILKDSRKCFVLLLVPELFLFCPVTHGSGEEKKILQPLLPLSLANKSPLDLLLSQSFNFPFFMSSEDGEQVLGSATALAQSTCSGCREPLVKGMYDNHCSSTSTALK